MHSHSLLHVHMYTAVPATQTTICHLHHYSYAATLLKQHPKKKKKKHFTNPTSTEAHSSLQNKIMWYRHQMTEDGFVHTVLEEVTEGHGQGENGCWARVCLGPVISSMIRCIIMALLSSEDFLPLLKIARPC